MLFSCADKRVTHSFGSRISIDFMLLPNDIDIEKGYEDSGIEGDFQTNILFARYA